ncbi:hypothetical protein GCM10011608_45050 [Micromonospora sonchi]|uniref:alpha-amylase n=1 Tax=Micromonospora sonchi TaxID=1763543 RepID=A0A917U3Y8_9ACTN|nr:carbohydrate-binding module family 20 domain-containing protein [Micromonospora sonchi]GGM55174.1 hypothetical protein GCM10011608_45050 [Micromonospora sonchi]
MTAVTFGVTATTTLGQNTHVAGDHPSLGDWDPTKAPLLSSATGGNRTVTVGNGGTPLNDTWRN